MDNKLYGTLMSVWFSRIVWVVLVVLGIIIAAFLVLIFIKLLKTILRKIKAIYDEHNRFY